MTKFDIFEKVLKKTHKYLICFLYLLLGYGLIMAIIIFICYFSLMPIVLKKYWNQYLALGKGDSI